MTAVRDQDAVGRFVERFASVLTEAGIPRMPARVFAALLTADSSSLTAAELAGKLDARRLRRGSVPNVRVRRRSTTPTG